MKPTIVLDQQSSDLARACAEEAGITVEQYIVSAISAFHYMAKPLVNNQRIDIAIDGVPITSFTLRDDVEVLHDTTD